MMIVFLDAGRNMAWRLRFRLREVAMLRKKKEPKPRRKILETLLRDMQGTAEQKLVLFEKLRAAGGFSNEHPRDLAKAEKMLRDFAAMEKGS
jgi:hypothetical protein